MLHQNCWPQNIKKSQPKEKQFIYFIFNLFSMSIVCMNDVNWRVFTYKYEWYTHSTTISSSTRKSYLPNAMQNAMYLYNQIAICNQIVVIRCSLLLLPKEDKHSVSSHTHTHTKLIKKKR